MVEEVFLSEGSLPASLLHPFSPLLIHSFRFSFVGVVKEVPSYQADPAPVPSERIVFEEKGIHDSREAEKDAEVQQIPQPVREMEQERPESSSDRDDAWSTRQSTMEERVIDHYVIETHAETPAEEPAAEEEQAEVLISSSWDQGAPAVQEEDEAALEREFNAALQQEDEGDDRQAFSAELLSRSLQQPTSGQLI